MSQTELLKARRNNISNFYKIEIFFDLSCTLGLAENIVFEFADSLMIVSALVLLYHITDYIQI